MDSLHAAAHETLPDFLFGAVSLGFIQIGQVVIEKKTEGFSLRHESDTDHKGLEIFCSPEDAVGIARCDDSGDYRPLKTAPNLRRGWELRLDSLSALHFALDGIYPAALGNWRSVLRGEKIAPPLRETIDRQTGMYRITGLLTRYEASNLIGSLCQTGCLRQILWPIEGADTDPVTETSKVRIPLFCSNACSHFLSKALEIVKSRPVEL
jgi:sirohydrochlorin cobaltochelatase